jgi:acetyl-CoA carboxylase carboxyl transferase subunit beta
LDVAGRLGLPVVTLIDTRGADPLPSSEGHGIAAAIARTFETLLGCPSPTLAVVIGEGGSGGALAMGVCDRVLAWENAVFSVIAPEGAASILYRDATRGPELAERLGITASDLVELGIADEIVAEPPGGAHTDPVAAAETLSEHIAAGVADLARMSARKRLKARHIRWREAGNDWIRPR